MCLPYHVSLQFLYMYILNKKKKNDEQIQCDNMKRNLNYCGTLKSKSSLHFSQLHVLVVFNLFQCWLQCNPFPSFFVGHFEHSPFNNETKRTVYHVRSFDVFRLKQVLFRKSSLYYLSLLKIKNVTFYTCLLQSLYDCFSVLIHLFLTFQCLYFMHVKGVTKVKHLE